MRREANRKPGVIVLTNPTSPITEIYRNLQFNIQYSAIQHGVKTITITSANWGEGKTTTTINLATALALSGKRVVLVDANLRNPAIHHAFGLANGQGLSRYLSEQLPIDELIRETSVRNLSVITAGPVTPNPSDLLASVQMKALLDRLYHNFDVILIDTPPILTLTDAKIMATSSDGVLLVVEHGKLKRAIARKIKEDLTLMKANLIGIVFNKIHRKEAETYLS